jgi:protein kinase-like protein/putative pyrroloquinoline-quinone binding quinoprotein/putative pyrroloquinoline-quinone-binding quinoprotein
MESLAVEDPRTAGEFRLRARLGTGGMGRVYLGMSPAGRPVAVKVVHPELARDAEFVGRFRSEVAAAQAVNGIYTAQVVATGPYDNPPWLATAYVPGPTLQQLVDERGPLPEAALWRLGAGLTEALRAVHGAGLIHRDLKPNNVLVAEDGPRVIDFGVSRALDATSHTRPGQTFGTPSFMSPEQARGQAVGVASDVFSLGAVLCFAATGRAPFGDQNLLTVLYRVVHEDPALDGLDGPLRELTAGCMAKDPAARPTLAQLTTSFAVHAGERDGRFWPAAVRTAIRGYENVDLDGLPQPAVVRPASLRSDAVWSDVMRPEAVAPETMRPGALRPGAGTAADRPSTSRRRLLTIAGGLGGVIVAGAAVGWALDQSGKKTPTGKLARNVSRPGTRTTTPAPGKTPEPVKSPAGQGSGAAAGRVIWRAAVDGQVSPDGLAVSDGVVVAGPTDGLASAFDAISGAHRWTLSVGSEPFQILAQGGTVVALGTGQGNSITGLAATTGLVQWSTSFTTNGAHMAISGDLCVVAASTLKTVPDVTAYSLSTGAKAWTFKLPGQPNSAPSSITAAGGSFYVADMSTNVWQLSATGSVVAKFTAPAPWPDPIAVTGQILCGLADTVTNAAGPDFLYAMDISTRATLWSTRLDGSAPNSMLADHGVVYTAGPASGGSAIMMRDAGTGAVGWRHDWSGDSVVGPALAFAPTANLLLAGVGRDLCSLSVTSGDQQWQLPLDGGILAIEVAGDIAYVSTSLATATDVEAGGWLYAVRL